MTTGSKDTGTLTNLDVASLLLQPGHYVIDRAYMTLDLVSYHMEEVFQTQDGRFSVLKLSQLTDQEKKELDITYKTLLDRVSQCPRTTIKLSVTERLIPIMKSADDRKAAIKLHAELLEQYANECKAKFSIA